MTQPDSWFPDSEDELTQDPFFVVAITGPQASGKSTLANALFNSSFPVASRGSVGSATTRGILSSRVQSPVPTLILDVEGADARSRGRDAKLFASQCASFVSALADVVIVNLWFHDACRLDSAAYALLRSILKACAQALVDGAEARTALVIAVRDADDDSQGSLESLQDMIAVDVRSIFLFCAYFFHLCNLLHHLTFPVLCIYLPLYFPCLATFLDWRDLE